jgi:hypothetical protein
MKLDDFAHAVVKKVFHELEHTHHFKVPPAIREAVLKKIKEDLSTLIE